MNTSDIVIYGVSGYTGKLIAESLHKRGIPFTAAGRNAEKITKALEIVAQRAGAGSTDAEVVAVTHDEASLTELFSGAKVVVNVTGVESLSTTVIRLRKPMLKSACRGRYSTGSARG